LKKINIFNLKDAELASYTFIEELQTAYRFFYAKEG